MPPQILEYNIAVLVFSMLGRFSITFALNTVLQLNYEIMPTQLRAQGYLGIRIPFYRDGEVPQMTTSSQSTSSRILEDLAPGTGPQNRSFLCLSNKNRISSLLQVLHF